MIPGISKSPKATRVRVDASKCTGHGVCIEVAPDLFALDRFGFAYVTESAHADLAASGDARARVREAEARCPDRAIIVERVEVIAPVAIDPTAAVGDPGPRLLVDGASDLAELRALDPSAIDPDAVISELDASGLCGHGGAHFSVAAKWRSVRGSGAVVVVNGAEREPGTVKDRHLLETRPFAVLLGAAITARVVRADRILVAIDVEHEDATNSMQAALAQAQDVALLAGVAVELRTVPARYVAGEESALIESLEGNAPLPRVRPPFPTIRGYQGAPTVVHNVETLVQIGSIARHGASWFREAGTVAEPGSGIFSVGRYGETATPVERPYGSDLRTLLGDVGLDGDVGAVIVGGWSGGVLRPDQLDVALTHLELAARGAALGTKSIQVVPTDRCIVDVAAEVVAYFGGESAQQCPSCEQGLPWIADQLRALERGDATPLDIDEVRAFATSLPRRGACALPDGAVRFLQSVFTNFSEVVSAHLAAHVHEGDQS